MNYFAQFSKSIHLDLPKIHFRFYQCINYLISLAASKIAFIVDEEVQLNAGSATALSLQYLINLIKLSPVTTPGGTIPCNPGIFGFVMFYEYFEIYKNTC